MHIKTSTDSVDAGKNILILFAPKFTSFGCDIGREFIQKQGGGKVFGLCTGPESVSEKVSKELDELCGRLWRLEEEEPRWLAQAVSEADLEQFDRDYGPAVFGKTIVADRRIGRGFVRGGLTRPDVIEDACNRNSNLVPQRYVIGLYKFLWSVYKQARPDIVFCYSVAGALALAMAELCRVKNIPFTQIVPTRVENRFMIDEGELGLFEPVARRFKEASGDRAALAAERRSAQQYIARFREKPETPEYQKLVTTRLGSQSAWKVTVKAFRSFARQTIRLPNSNYEEYKISLRRSFFHVQNVWRKRLLPRHQFSAMDSVPGRFAYFPLHVDPEASTMIKSPWHTDQLSVIEALAKSVPAHLTVVVKEHLPMLGMRPRGFYEQIANMPRVVLLGPEHEGLGLVVRADLTVVITGTAAWEAMCLGRPTLVIGSSPFLAVGEGAVHEPSLAALPEAIEKALSISPAADEVLEAYVAALIAESFEMPTSLLWDKYETHPKELRRSLAVRIASDLGQRMEERALARLM